MNNSETNLREVKRTRRLLKQIVETASAASLTGALEGGGGQATQQYNAIVQRLEQIGEVPVGFFAPLSPDTSFDNVGVAAAQVAAYIEDEEETKPEAHQSKGDVNISVNGPIGNLGDLEELRALGQRIRESLPDWMRGKQPDAKPEEPAPAPMPDPPPVPPTVYAAPPSPPTPPRPAIAEAALTAQFTPDQPGVRSRV